jgi:plastocyanin
VRSLVVIVATLAFAPAAYAQGATITAVDNPSSWTPERVTIKAGETVTWTFAGTTGLHNVISRGSNWGWRSGEYQSGGPDVSYKFETTGVYEFACEVHPMMDGFVDVTDASGTPPPPPPPPPPSEQHWENDQQSPTLFELVDEARPKLKRVRVNGVRNGARVRFRLSERARVHVRFRFGGVVVKSARKTFGAGPGRLTVRDRRMDGRYRIEVFARDLSGNRSRVKHARVTVR